MSAPGPPDRGAVSAAVRDLLGRLARAGDRGRTAEVAACYLPDGVLDVGAFGGSHIGRDAIAAYLEGVAGSLGADGPALVRHHVSSTEVRLTGPHEAEADSYFLVLTNRGPDHWGRYRDRLRPDPDRPGEWLLAHRSVRVDAFAPDSRFGPA